MIHFLRLIMITAAGMLAASVGASGSETSYTLRVEPGRYDNVFFPQEQKSVDVVIGNLSGAPRTVELDLRMQFDNGDVLEASQSVALPASGETTIPFALNLEGPCFGDGVFSIRGEATQVRTTVAVVLPPQLGDLPFEEVFFGTHIMIHPEVARRVGIRFFRTPIYWRWTENQPGSYNFAKDVERAHDALEHGVGHIWTFEPNLPAWLDLEHMVFLNRPEPLELFRKWVHAGVSALPKELMAVEISNEPDITMGRTPLASEAEAVKAATDILVEGYKVVKAIDPSIAVLGGGASGSAAKQGGFSHHMLELAKGDIDYYAAHLYCHARYVKEEGGVMWPDEYLMQMLEENAKLAVEYTRGKSLWSTELGWAYPMDDIYLSQTTREYAAITAQALVLSKAAAHVGKVAWFRGYQYKLGLNERGYDYSLFVQQGERLRPTTGVSAYATVSSLLEGSDSGRVLELGPAMRGYSFANKATGQVVAALWTTHYDASLKGELPAGVTILDLYGRTLSAEAWTLSRGPGFLVAPLNQQDALRTFLQSANWRPEQPFVIVAVGANNVNEFHFEVDSLLLEPVMATFTLGSLRAERELKPGLNRVRIACADGTIAGGNLSARLRIEGGGAAVETPVEKLLLAVPYRAARALAPEAGLTAQKLALATTVVDAKENISPPDPAIPWEGPEDLSVAFGYAWNEDGLYAIYRVRDDIHTGAADRGFWNYDSVQLALDPLTLGGRSGYRPGQRELGAFRDSSGQTVAVQSFPPTDSAPEISLEITEEQGGMVYELFIPWRYLYGRNAKVNAGAVIGANFIVNDNDGSGRDCWIGLVDGIGDAKQPEIYPWLYLQPR